MHIFSRAPLLRWVVPVLVAVVLVAGGWTISQLSALARDGLKPRTAAQLLVDIQHARVDGLSGTIVQRADLGIPDLPGSSGSSDLSSLVSGSHTMRVWLSGPDKARLALLGTFGESDVILNGKDLWTWSSREKAAVHHTLNLPSSHGFGGLPRAGKLPITPEQAAAAALKAIEPSTQVDTSGTAVVAGRSAYELVLSPRASGSMIGQVRIAIDGATRLPLRVQVIPRGATEPAFEVGFTHFDPTRPDDAQFTFNPPPGTKVTEHSGAYGPDRPQLRGPSDSFGDLEEPKVVGDGWTSVLVAQTSTRTAADPSAGPSAGTDGLPAPLAQMMTTLPSVSGTWGTGRLLRGTLFSVVVTNDGRVAVGAVAPSLLYDALAAR